MASAKIAECFAKKSRKIFPSQDVPTPIQTDWML